MPKKRKQPKTQNMTFRFSVYIKDCDKVFKEGMEPGCIGYQDVDFKDVPVPAGGRFIQALMDHENRVRDEMVRVDFKDITDQS